MGKLNLVAAIVGMSVLWIARHFPSFDTPYDIPVLMFAIILFAWVSSDGYLERMVKMDRWVRRVEVKR